MGSGGGQFLAAHCSAHPTTLTIGTEIKLERCRKAARKLTAAGARNGLVIRGRAEEVLAQLPPAALDAVHVYFPDPWPKRRHRRRRLLRRDVVADLACRLRPGGAIHLVTDFFDYYLQAVVLFLLHPDLTLSRNPVQAPPLVQADTGLSRYGPRLAALGKEILHATAIRQAAR